MLAVRLTNHALQLRLGVANWLVLILVTASTIRGYLCKTAHLRSAQLFTKLKVDCSYLRLETISSAVLKAREGSLVQPCPTVARMVLAQAEVYVGQCAMASAAPCATSEQTGKSEG